MMNLKFFKILVVIYLFSIFNLLIFNLTTVSEQRFNIQRVIFRRSPLFKIKEKEKYRFEYSKDDATMSHSKIIVTATNFASDPDLWTKVFYRLVNEECEEDRCVISTNISDLPKADAVIFSSMDMTTNTSAEFKKRPRDSEQIYIYFSMEAPHAKHREKFKNFANFFNWTMTNRRDSDVFVPYGKVTKINGEAKKVSYLTPKEFKRKKMALFFSSHCHVWSKRLNLVKRLQRHIPVDLYGACGDKKCGNRTVLSSVAGNDVANDECQELVRNYLFYFAFENTLCTEYVTEKLYRALSLGIVPVVYGGVDYSAFAPPNSVIDAKKFGSVAKLAKYLKKVASDVALYNEFLKWRENYEVEIGSPYKPLICDLCKNLHTPELTRIKFSYESIEKWVLDGEEKCFTYNDFFPHDR